MARLVAVEWDKNEVRLAAGSRQGNTISIDALLSAPLVSVDSEESDADPGIAKVLRELTAKAGHSKGDLIVGAGRTSIELRALQLPPAEENDLPEMVRFAAQRQFAQIGDNWPLDFLKLPSSTPETIEVLAAAANPSTVKQIRKTCESAGHAVTQLLLRPTAAGSLACISSPDIRSGTVLLVDILNDEADLVITEQGHVSFVRTARLPHGDLAVTQRALSAEIKRTMIASGSQRPSAVVSKIVVWGDAKSTTELAARLQESVGLPTTTLDPLDLVQSKSIRNTLPSGGSGRFAPLIGMLMQSSGCSPHSIDFLHPRKRVEKKKPIRQMATVGIAAGLVLLLGVLWFFNEHRKLNSQIAELTAKNTALKPKVANATIQVAKWKVLEKFLISDIQWLDQLAYISNNSLPPDKMIHGDLTMKVVDEKPPMGSKLATKIRGSISGKVGLTEPGLVDEYENQIRSDDYEIIHRTDVQGKDDKSVYRWVADPEIRTEQKKILDRPKLNPNAIAKDSASDKPSDKPEKVEPDTEKPNDSPVESNPTTDDTPRAQVAPPKIESAAGEAIEVAGKS